MLKWMSDPENREKLTVFVDKTLFVVGKLFDFAAFLYDQSIRWSWSVIW